MSRSLVLGNGNIFVGLDNSGYVREFYFPFVGLENHIASHSQHRIGIFVDESFSWLHHDDWQTVIDCLDDTMAGITIKTNQKLQIKIYLTDIVYNESNIFLRSIKIENLANFDRTAKLFFGQEFELYESHRGDTAYFEPKSNTIIHYKGQRVFLVNLQDQHKTGFDDYTTGIFNIYGKEGSFKDAEDGNLQKNPIEHGPCDSVVAKTLTLPANQSETLNYWLCATESIDEARKLNDYVIDKTPEHIIESTTDYWRAWVNRHDFSLTNLSDLFKKLFNKSLFYIKAHVDRRGAIIASGDTSMLQNGKDTYSYMWPRDAAFSSLVLDETGDHTASQRFFEFCNQIIERDGYFMHKYLPDKSLGSSWHSWLQDGQAILPIQEDETAIVLFALKKHYDSNKDLEFIESLYNSLIKKAGDFLINFRESITGLPKPSYDLWEEKYGIHTFTACSVYGALKSASYFAEILGKEDDEQRFNEAAEMYKIAILEHLFIKEQGIFRKSILVKPDGKIVYDDTIDASSVYGVFMFNVLEPSDTKLLKAFNLSEKVLQVKTQIGGIARYVGDNYFRKSHDIVGNPWIITTLWFAQYKIATSKTIEDLSSVKKTLTWVAEHASESGMLSEQIDPYSGERLSSTPLTWSHAEYVRTILAYIEKTKQIKK